MKRIFHPHITPVVKAALVLFVLLAVYYFWTQQPLFGLIATLVAVLATDRVLHTTYVFAQNSSGVEELIITHGRLSRSRVIRVSDIVRITPMRTAFGLSRYLLLHYGTHHLQSVQPDDVKGFIQELKKRQ